jgi:hypothetical protein
MKISINNQLLLPLQIGKKVLKYTLQVMLIRYAVGYIGHVVPSAVHTHILDMAFIMMCNENCGKRC